MLQKAISQAESTLVGALGHNPSIADAVMDIPAVKDEVFNSILRSIVDECQVLCQKTPQSQFRHMSVKEIEEFKWESLVKELQTKSPLLLKILTAVVVRIDSRYAPKSQIVHHPAIVTAIAVLLKERNREMSGVQSINSCLMYACHCEKQVCMLGNRVMFWCLLCN